MAQVRPDGSGQITAGWVLALAGCGMAVGAILIKVETYPAIDVEAVALRWNLLAGGGAALGIALLLIATGWIIRAISFLPGRHDTVEPTAPPEVGVEQPNDVQASGPVDSMTSFAMMAGGIILFIVLVLSVVAKM